MRDKELVDKMISLLERNGEIKLYNNEKDINITIVNNNGRNLYMSSDNEQFNSSSEAIDWAIRKLQGIQNIQRLESKPDYPNTFY